LTLSRPAFLFCFFEWRGHPHATTGTLALRFKTWLVANLPQVTSATFAFLDAPPIVGILHCFFFFSPLPRRSRKTTVFPADWLSRSHSFNGLPVYGTHRVKSTFLLEWLRLNRCCDPSFMLRLTLFYGIPVRNRVPAIAPIPPPRPFYFSPPLAGSPWRIRAISSSLPLSMRIFRFWFNPNRSKYLAKPLAQCLPLLFAQPTLLLMSA